MFRTLMALCCAAAFAFTPASDPKLLKAMDTWLKNYKPESFKSEPPNEPAKFLDLTSSKDIEHLSVLKANGILPKGLLGKLTTKRELEVMLGLALENDDGETMQRVLMFAAAGHDQRKYNREMAPHVVRSLADDVVIKLKSPSARESLIKTASANQGDKAVRAAALRSIGALGDAAHRPLLEQQLGASDGFVRHAAAGGLRRLALKESFDPLCQALARDTDGLAIEGIVAALSEIMKQHDKALSDPAKNHAADCAVAALGKSNSWRADVTLIDFLDLFRNSGAIPALIDLLERFQKNLDQVKAGKLSGLLQHRAQDALVSLTGAYFPMDKPAEWRAWWEKVRETFKVVEKKTAAPGATVAGFFGIPVRGTRVVFVLDLSGSMLFTMSTGAPTTTAGDGKDVADTLEKRLAVAKRELTAAIERMPEYSSFALVLFAGSAWTWDGKDGPAEAKETAKVQMFQATKPNKDLVKKYINDPDEEKGMAAITDPKKQKHAAGTNIWAGLEKGLEVKAEVYGGRYETVADEMFLLSDGLPSVGDILHPKDILKQVRDRNEHSKLRINSIYISGNETPQDLELIERYGMNGGEFMKLLAEQNHGKFVEKK